MTVLEVENLKKIKFRRYSSKNSKKETARSAPLFKNS